MFDPITIGVGAVLWMAFRKQSDTHYGILTPEREEVYKNAIVHCQDPRKLIELAKDFEKFGLKAQAFTMRARAAWRSRTSEQKAAHEKIFAKALQSENVEAILEVAKVFDSMTATVKAGQLRERAKSLLEVRKVESPKPKAPHQGTGNGMSGHTTKEPSDGLRENPKPAE